jgi:glycerol kinase
MTSFVGALDQGTTSTRFIIFDHGGHVISVEQKEHKQIFPHPGWVEHDPMEIWKNVRDVIQGALTKGGLSGSQLAGIGITNQRETAVMWNKHTGKPFSNAIVWQCTRTHEICKTLSSEGGQDRFRDKTGLPIATYFSGPKIKWILENVPEAREASHKGSAYLQGDIAPQGEYDPGGSGYKDRRSGA